jgi:hypothetical protein
MANVSTGVRLEAFNQALVSWSKETQDLLKSRLTGLGLDQRRALQRGSSRLRTASISKLSNTKRLVRDEYLIQSIKYSIRRNGLEVDSVGFSFARHGIFLEAGVGKNRPKGSGKESPKPWIAPVLDRQVQELSNIIGDGYADLITGELNIVIPGIYSTRITL